MFGGWGYCDGHETAGTGTVSFAAYPVYNNIIYWLIFNIVGLVLVLILVLNSILLLSHG